MSTETQLATAAAGTGEQAGPVARSGRNELGMIRIADGVVTKIAARAAAENPSAGAAAARMLGRAVPGASRLPGVRDTDLQGLPKTSVIVDGSKAYVTLELSVRWPASIPDVTGQVRGHVRDRVRELAGLDVDEVHITVADLALDVAPPPRVQ
ncbi:MAG TPA: Asp23/Gls24 family envelope stress response protein [Streptosporangiaceae bacterium]|nr:Asp23/Gls24 family envelope stress response protein [Streptosporangiaceae bacterium]